MVRQLGFEMDETSKEKTANAPRKEPWLKPVLTSASIKEITATGQGSGTDGGGMTGMEMASDVRLKTDLVLVDRLANGLPVYTFRYIWSGTRYQGVMAQDVLEVCPDAVSLDATGYYRVDYALIGARPRRLN